MPINIQKLKELPEELCFSVSSAGGHQYRIYEFLKNNQQAYSPKEISDELNLENSKFVGGGYKKIFSNNISTALKKMITESLLKDKYPNLKKKGSYYWYEN